MPTRVLIVDDSPVIRSLLTQELNKDLGVEVIGSAPDPYVARDMIVDLHPDLVLLDLTMPRLDGLTFLNKLMRYFPLPVIVLTTPTVEGHEQCLAALEAGAVDMVNKPSDPEGVSLLIRELIIKIKAAQGVCWKWQCPPPKFDTSTSPRLTLARAPSKIVVIGSSTGGTRALERILPMFPANGPAILIAQHMPAQFTRSFAKRLNQLCAMEVKEAEEDDVVQPGRVLLAPGDFHMLLKKTLLGFRVQIKGGPRVSHQRPSVDVLFTSVARCAGDRAIGVMLTGMGGDGADGMLLMHQSGAVTIAQDEASCVIFGMPRMAIEKGGVDHVLPLERIPRKVLELATESVTPAGARG